MVGSDFRLAKKVKGGNMQRSTQEAKYDLEDLKIKYKMKIHWPGRAGEGNGGVM